MRESRAVRCLARMAGAVKRMLELRVDAATIAAIMETGRQSSTWTQRDLLEAGVRLDDAAEILLRLPDLPPDMEYASLAGTLCCATRARTSSSTRSSHVLRCEGDCTVKTRTTKTSTIGAGPVPFVRRRQVRPPVNARARPT